MSYIERMQSTFHRALTERNPVTRSVCRQIVLAKLLDDMPPPKPREMPHPDPIMSAFSQWSDQ